jgi:hypothetical protein
MPSLACHGTTPLLDPVSNPPWYLLDFVGKVRYRPLVSAQLICAARPTAHLLFVHQASRVLAFVVELLNPSSLARDFIVARVLTVFVSSPARCRLQSKVVVVPCVIKKSQVLGEDEASSVIFTKCSTKSSNKSSILWV